MARGLCMAHYQLARRRARGQRSEVDVARLRARAKAERFRLWRERRNARLRARFEHDSEFWVRKPMQLQQAIAEKSGHVRALVAWPCETCGCPPTFDGCPLCQSL